MKNVTLKDLLKDNIELAEQSLVRDDELTKIEQLLSIAGELDTLVLNQKTKNIVNRILGNFPTLANLFFETGLKLDDKEEYEEAIFWYRLSHMMTPNAKCINNIAIIYATTDMEKYAIDLLKNALQLFPNDDTLLENLQTLN